MLDKVEDEVIKKINEIGKDIENEKKASGDKSLGFKDKSLEKEARRFYRENRLSEMPNEKNTRLYLKYEELSKEIMLSDNIENAFLEIMTSFVMSFSKGNVAMADMILKKIAQICATRFRVNRED